MSAQEKLIIAADSDIPVRETGSFGDDGRLPNPFPPEHSGYGHMVDGVFVSSHPEGSEMHDFHVAAHDKVRAYVLDQSRQEGDPRFPCVFGQAAFRTEQYSFSAYEDITDADTATGVMHDVIQSQEELEIPAVPARTRGIFRSTLMAFKYPEIRDEAHGMEVLYTLLKNMHDVNSQHYDWTDGFSNDTESSDFGYAAGESAHFIAFFHPHAYAPARRHDVQFLVLNSHHVVNEYKNAKGMEHHARMKAEIRSRQEGPIHPHLGDHGAVPDFLQYALTDPDSAAQAKERTMRQAILGECPFHDPAATEEPEPNSQHHDEQ